MRFIEMTDETTQIKPLYGFSDQLIVFQSTPNSLKISLNNQSFEINIEEIKDLFVYKDMFLVSFKDRKCIYKVNETCEIITETSNNLKVIGFNDYIYTFKDKLVVLNYEFDAIQSIDIGDIGECYYNNSKLLVLLKEEVLVYDIQEKVKTTSINLISLFRIYFSFTPCCVSCNSSGNLFSLLDKDGGLKIYVVGFGFIDISVAHVKAVKWDVTDDRLLLVEVEKTQENSVVLYFINARKKKAYKYDCLSLEQDVQVIIGLNAPNIYYLKKENGSLSSCSINFIDFDYNEKLDNSMIKDYLDFAFYMLSVMFNDAAKIAKNMKSLKPLDYFVKLCIKNGNLELALTCISMMRKPHLLQYMKNMDPSEKLAFLAEIFNVKNPAETDHKYLIKILHSKSSQAVTYAETNHKIATRNCYYHTAKMYEEQGDYENAALNYEKANTGSEIGRMLMKDPSKAEVLTKGREETLKRWWAKYAESQGAYEQARDLYHECGEFESLIRVLCNLGDIDRAEEVTKSKPACFHLGKYFYSVGNLKKAVFYFGKASCLHHASRIAKENNMVTELLQIALLGTKSLMLEIGKFFEERGVFDNAATLFYKGGNFNKAIDICLNYQLDYLLDIIANDNSQGDVSGFKKLAEYFANKGDAIRSVELFLQVHEIKEALEVVRNFKVVLSESMADKISSKIEESQVNKNEYRLQLAQLCLEQGSFHLACKYFTQAGDRINAMKALIKSGDTEKITFFASVSGQKNKEIYVLAANYLSTSLPWQENENLDILKNIISFYSKAKAFENLANFYETYAQNEIDWYSDYEKAVGALEEALKIRKLKIEQNSANVSKCSLLERKISMVQVYIKALVKLNNNPSDSKDMERLLNELKSTQELVARKGDVIGSLIKAAKKTGNKHKVEEMFRLLLRTVKKSHLKSFVDEDLIKEYQYLLMDS